VRCAQLYFHLYFCWGPIMAQITIYLDADTEKRARAAARAEGVSLSSWIVDRIRSRERRDWPASVRSLAGAWTDLPTAEKIRATRAKDMARAKL
jgi:hypothetical protein